MRSVTVDSCSVYARSRPSASRKLTDRCISALSLFNPELRCAQNRSVRYEKRFRRSVSVCNHRDLVMIRPSGSCASEKFTHQHHPCMPNEGKVVKRTLFFPCSPTLQREACPLLILQDEKASSLLTWSPRSISAFTCSSMARNLHARLVSYTPTAHTLYSASFGLFP